MVAWKKGIGTEHCYMPVMELSKVYMCLQNDLWPAWSPKHSMNKTSRLLNRGDISAYVGILNGRTFGTMGRAHAMQPPVLDIPLAECACQVGVPLC